eukprot:CAMPEP_0178948858 /NCGR_PEP_ID=MMETSP0789-20121207/5709_1 /TAXON_ID=3005 /ORGANISM="Rhizosolenia setigera, Strain CCMP 1694" /LENGTH=367 /DNA_ID=CAMNT_0020629277 /DNA_START=59 /DNA_END=1163 /DNA_ORIENTATION=-
MGQYLTTPSNTATAPLLAPAIEGNLEVIQKMIGEQIAAADNDKTKNVVEEYVNQADKDGNTALIGAIFKGNLEITRFLLEKCGASLDVKNSLGCSPVWLACGYNHLDVLKYILSQYNPSPPTSQEEKENSRKLLLKKIVLEDANNSGDSPFLAAVSKGNFEICEYLIEVVEPNFRYDLISKKNKKGDFSLSVCISTSSDVVSPLLKLILSDSTTNTTNNASDKLIDQVNSNGLTPLLIACERNNAPIVEELLSRGANISKCDSDGKNPLHVAAFCGCEDVVKILLSSKNEKKSALLEGLDKNGATPLWLASRTGNTKMCRLILEEVPEEMRASLLSKRDKVENLTPHEVATKYKKEKLVEYFDSLQA